MDILDEPVAAVNANVKYGGFWQRAIASVIDSLVLIPITFGVSYFNITDWKSVQILILLNLAAMAYKPYMEYTYRATLGKMATNLKVVNLQYEQPTLNEILLRNVFHIGETFFSLIFTVYIFLQPDFEEISGWMEFSAFSNDFQGQQVVNLLILLITLIDVVLLLADDKKRSWHDRIGKTYVIEEES